MTATVTPAGAEAAPLVTAPAAVGVLPGGATGWTPTSTDPSNPAPPSRASSAPSVVARPRVLVGRWIDGWLVGGFGVAAWLVLVGAPAMTGAEVPGLRGPVLWALLAVIATHFAISYHLAYGQGRAALAQHPVALVAVPVGLVAFTAVVAVAAAGGLPVVADGGPRIALVTVYSLTTWHYVKQTYGVVRVGGALSGFAIGPRAAQVLRYGLYPLWLFEATTVWSRGYRANDYGFDASFALLPESTVSLLRVGSLATAAAIIVAIVASSLGSRRFPPATVWTPYAVAFLWILAQPDHISAILVFGAVHALQYLACAHRAEVAWGEERREPPSVWWCSVFGGALAAGMLLTYWLPMWLGYADGGRFGITMAAMVFVVLNLHHYAIDAAIWRSSGEHVRRIAKGPAPSR